MKNTQPLRLTSLQKAYYTIRKQKEEIQKLKNNLNSTPIAIVGLACRFPGKVNNENEFWRLLNEERSAIKEVPSDRWDKSKLYDEDSLEPGKTNSKWGGFVDEFAHFDPDFFNVSRAELLEMDPQQRLLMLVAYEALENSGFLQSKDTSSSGGVFIGIGGMDHGFYLNKNTDNDEVGPYLGSGNAYSVASGRLSNLFGWTGPAVSYDTACSSSLVSVHYACMHLAMKDCDIALAGGVNVLLSESVQISLSKAGMLSPDGKCKTFDEKANGYVRGEGCGMLVLKRLDDAIKDNDNIRGVISGSAIAQDGNSGGLTIPNRTSQELVIKKAIKKAGINPSDIQYVEAHGTGTSLGDPIEIDALSHVLSSTENIKLKIPIGSVKTNIGHLEAAAGIAGIIKVVLSIENNSIPAHLNCNEPSNLIDWENIALEVCQTKRKWNKSKAKYAGVSSFGFAGTIGHMVIKEAPKKEAVKAIDNNEKWDLIITAKTEDALQDFLKKYKSYLEHTEDTWLDICYTAGFFRPHYDFKVIISAENKEHAVAQLLTNLEQKINEKVERLELPKQGNKVTLPNYPFQTSVYLKHKKVQAITSLIEPIWVDMPDELLNIEDSNFLIIASHTQNEDHYLLKMISERMSNITLLPASNWGGQIKNTDYFNGEPFHIVYIVDKEKLDNNTIVKPVWEMVSGISNLMKRRDNAFKCMFLVGENTELMSALCGVLKTATLELPDFNFKQLTHSKGEIFDDTILKYLNTSYRHTQVQLDASPKFLQLAPIQANVNREKLELSSKEIFIISGGLGSLGRELAVFLMEKGASKIWLLSRNKIEDEKRSERIDWFTKWKGKNNDLQVIQCDCSSDIDMEQLNEKINAESHLVGGIFHVAGMNKQQPLYKITEADCEYVMNAKVKGAKLFDYYSRIWDVDYFVLFSSIAAVWGSSHLGHYSAANAFLDGIIRERKALGLTGLSINWSAWKGSFMLEGNAEGMTVLRDSGVGFMEPEEALKALEYLLVSNFSQIVVCENEWEKFIPLLEMNGINPFWDQLRVSEKVPEEQNKEHFILEGKNPEEEERYLMNYLKKELAYLLQTPDNKTIEEDRSFNELGLDSILAVRFVKKLNQLMALELSTNVVFNYPNLRNLVNHIYLELIEDKITNQSVNGEEVNVESNEVEEDKDWLDKIELHLQKYDK